MTNTLLNFLIILYYLVISRGDTLHSATFKYATQWASINSWSHDVKDLPFLYSRAFKNYANGTDQKELFSVILLISCYILSIKMSIPNVVSNKGYAADNCIGCHRNWQLVYPVLISSLTQRWLNNEHLINYYIFWVFHVHEGLLHWELKITINDVINSVQQVDDSGIA